MRIILYLLTNLAVLLVASVVLQALGVEQILHDNGIGWNLTGMLIFAAVFGMAGSFISLLLSKKMARWSTGAKVIDEPRSDAEQWLVETVRSQAQAAEIGMPDVAIFDSPTPNAFATGARRDHALVAVSTGLLQTMRRDEVEAVLGHEVSHVANGDMVTMALLQGVLNTFVIFLSRIVGMVVDSMLRRGESRGGMGIGYFVTSIAAQIVFGILASMVVMAFSRHREFRADAGAARLVGPGAMIRALERLKSSHAPVALPQSVEALGINGQVRGALGRLLASHPPLDERIAALRAGGG